MLELVGRWLEEYQENYRRGDLPALDLRGMYALFPEEGLADFVTSRWNEPYPNSESAGVYLIFGKTGTLLHVGKASMGASIGGRLGTHFAGKNECKLLASEWNERPSYVATIAVPDGMGFEAAALEEYLISRWRLRDRSLGLPGRDDALHGEVPTHGSEAPSSTVAGTAPEVYTYSAPGMPMCPHCGQRPAIFYCSTHDAAACLECVGKHDESGKCVYVPAYRAPRSEAPRAPASVPPGAASTKRPRSILGIE